MPASKAGGVAHQEADVLAHNLAVEINGKGQTGRSLAAYDMTARIRRWTRCRKSNDLSDRLAAVRRHRATNLGSIKS